MEYELDEVEIFHLNQLKALKENETPIFQKCHDSLEEPEKISHGAMTL